MPQEQVFKTRLQGFEATGSVAEFKEQGNLPYCTVQELVYALCNMLLTQLPHYAFL